MAQVGQQRVPVSTRRRSTARRFYHHRTAIFSLAVLILVIAATAAADWIAPFNPSEQHLDRILHPPGREFLLGTDTLGRDNLSRILHGGRVSLRVGGAVAVIIGIVGTLVGLTAGYYGGRVDSVLMRLTDTLLALPALMVALKEREFVEAARALGLPDRRIMFRHLLPNLVGKVMVSVSLTVAAAILAESTLSFLGLGVNPARTATWGNMLGGNEGFVTTAPWLVWAPGLAIVLTALCVNFIGDGLRGSLDPTREQI